MDRILHMAAVANYMCEHAHEYSLDKEEMYILGLLHDVGYVGNPKEGHEKYGANLLQTKAGVTNPHILWCIAHHNETIPYFSWSIDRHRKMFLLLKADMSVDANGNVVGYKKRLEDICNRHGEDSSAYARSREIVDWLIKTEENRR